MNVTVDKLEPGTFGVSHGHGAGSLLIRSATGSWAGHAFLYVGNNQIVEGDPPVARVASANKYADAIWAWRMWDKLHSVDGWPQQKVEDAKIRVVNRAHSLVGCSYDWPAYVGFCLEVMSVRNGKQLSRVYAHDSYRTCSGLVEDAEVFGGVPMTFNPEDGPGIVNSPHDLAIMPINLVAPGMLLGLAQRKEWT